MNIDKVRVDLDPLSHSFKDLDGLGVMEVISKVSEPVFLLSSFAATVPYQLYQIKLAVDNMRKYEVGNPKRIQDPRLTIARRGLSAFGGVLGTIAIALGSGLLYAVGGSLKVATGVICLYTNARLFLNGCIQEKSAKTQQEREAARYNKLKGAMGFLSSATYIAYFVFAIAAGVCPPVIALAALAFALSLLCAYLEKEGTQEKLYEAKKIIEREGFMNWLRGKPSLDAQYRMCAEESARKLQERLV